MGREFVSHSPVDDADVGCIESVAVRDFATALNGYAHGAEVGRTNDGVTGAGHIFGVGGRAASI